MATILDNPRTKAGLNDPSTSYYEGFLGSHNWQMPLLIDAGMTPISFKGVWQRRLEVIRRLKEALEMHEPEERIKAWESLQTEWVDTHIGSGDGAVRHSSGSAKIAPDANYLRLLTPETPLRNGSVRLSGGDFIRLYGEHFTPGQVERYFEKSLTREEVKESPVWRALMRGDQALLNHVADTAFAQAEERFPYR